jgi:crossover junction endodeoxyribonuclease RuvC
MPYNERLMAINKEIVVLLETWKPTALSIEKIFFSKNVKTAIDVAQVRGTLLLECLKKGMTVDEYTPNEVKLAVTGYGGADKSQVQKMVKSLLNLEAIPKPDDTADALAIAICHLHSAKIRNLK